jgi:hypothetical protein
MPLPHESLLERVERSTFRSDRSRTSSIGSGSRSTRLVGPARNCGRSDVSSRRGLCWDVPEDRHPSEVYEAGTCEVAPAVPGICDTKMTAGHAINAWTRLEQAAPQSAVLSVDTPVRRAEPRERVHGVPADKRRLVNPSDRCLICSARGPQCSRRDDSMRPAVLSHFGRQPGNVLETGNGGERWNQCSSRASKWRFAAGSPLTAANDGYGPGLTSRRSLVRARHRPSPESPANRRLRAVTGLARRLRLWPDPGLNAPSRRRGGRGRASPSLSRDARMSARSSARSCLRSGQRRRSGHRRRARS